jgi:hypothetical protein
MPSKTKGSTDSRRVMMEESLRKVNKMVGIGERINKNIAAINDAKKELDQLTAERNDFIANLEKGQNIMNQEQTQKKTILLEFPIGGAVMKMCSSFEEALTYLHNVLTNRADLIVIIPVEVTLYGVKTGLSDIIIAIEYLNNEMTKEKQNPKPKPTYAITVKVEFKFLIDHDADLPSLSTALFHLRSIANNVKDTNQDTTVRITIVELKREFENVQDAIDSIKSIIDTVERAISNMRDCAICSDKDVCKNANADPVDKAIAFISNILRHAWTNEDDVKSVKVTVNGKATIKFNDGRKVKKVTHDGGTENYTPELLLEELISWTNEDDVKSVKVTVNGKAAKFDTVAAAVAELTKYVDFIKSVKESIKTRMSSAETIVVKGTSSKEERPAEPAKGDNKPIDSVITYIESLSIPKSVKTTIIVDYLRRYDNDKKVTKHTVILHASDLAYLRQVRAELLTLKDILLEQEKALDITKSIIIESEQELLKIIERTLA